MSAVSVLLGLLLLIQFGFKGSPWLRSIQPTGGVIRGATSSSPMGGASRRAAWAELERRALSPQEQTRLFHTLLDQRLTPFAFFSGPPNDFVGAYLASNLATEEDLRRHRAESFRPHLVHPAQVRRGETIPITLRGARVEEFLPSVNGVTIHLGGAWFDGDAPPLPGGRGYWTLDIDQGRVQPLIELRAERPGEQTFTVRLWFVARRFGLLDNPIDWNPNGTPILPADALWAEPIDLKRSVRVEP